jgi:hypothetical protein
MKLISLLGLLLFPLFATAHGDDKPGPNQGYLQMPGAFHTELVLSKDQSVHIYLLDMEFKNPTAKDSSVEVTYQDGGKSIPFKCAVMDTNHFHCVASEKYSIKKGHFIVKATREKAVGNVATYKLPLKLSSGTGHEMHH